MLFNLYLISILYTNTMGLIIISKCKPIIKHEYERKGYIVKEKNDTDNVINTLVSFAKFLIPGYYLKKALKMSGKNFDLDRIIEEKIKKDEIEKVSDFENPDDSIFRDERQSKIISLANTKKYQSSRNSMYSKDRHPNTIDYDKDFWEEEETTFTPFIDTSEENIESKRNPSKDYISSISEEEIENMVVYLEKIRKLKKSEYNLLNNNKAA